MSVVDVEDSLSCRDECEAGACDDVSTEEEFDPSDDEVWRRLSCLSSTELMKASGILGAALAWLQEGLQQPQRWHHKVKHPKRSWVYRPLALPCVFEKPKRHREKSWKRPGAASRRHRAWQQTPRGRNTYPPTTASQRSNRLQQDTAPANVPHPQTSTSL